MGVEVGENVGVVVGVIDGTLHAEIKREENQITKTLPLVKYIRCGSC